PEYELFFGRPAGSAMPLAWAHAEHLKLLRSLRDGAPFDLPPQTVQRYLKEQHPCSRAVWRFNHKLRSLAAGLTLRIEAQAPMLVYWSFNAWETVHNAPSVDSGLGTHFLDLDTSRLTAGRRIIFTFYWPEAGHWEGTDFMVTVTAASSESGACGRPTDSGSDDSNS